MLREEKIIEIEGKEFIISKFPAIEGREIVAQYPLSGIPKLGDYKTNEETMLKLMKYVQVVLPSGNISLVNKEIINNQVPSWEMLVKLEWAMMEYNVSFFGNGGVSTFFDDIRQKLPVWISQMWTALSGQLSPAEKPPSMN